MSEVRISEYHGSIVNWASLAPGNKEPSIYMDSKLYVGNLPFSATGEALRDLFSQAGAVTSAEVIMDRIAGRSKGFGFVEMASQAEAEKAISMFNGYMMDNRELRVNIARPREDSGRPSGGGRRPGGGGGGYNRGGGGGGGYNRGGYGGGGGGDERNRRGTPRR